MLNSAGHHNLISANHGVIRPWTVSSLQKPFKSALADLELQDKLDRDEEALTKIETADTNAVAATLPEETAARQASQTAAGEHPIIPAGESLAQKRLRILRATPRALRTHPAHRLLLQLRNRELPPQVRFQAHP